MCDPPVRRWPRRVRSRGGGPGRRGAAPLAQSIACQRAPEVICKAAVRTVPVLVGGVKKGRITPFLGENYSHVAKGLDFL